MQHVSLILRMAGGLAREAVGQHRRPRLFETSQRSDVTIQCASGATHPTFFSRDHAQSRYTLVQSGMSLLAISRDKSGKDQLDKESGLFSIEITVCII